MGGFGTVLGPVAGRFQDDSWMVLGHEGRLQDGSRTVRGRFQHGARSSRTILGKGAARQPKSRKSELGWAKAEGDQFVMTTFIENGGNLGFHR